MSAEPGHGRIRVEPGYKRVRAYLHGYLVVDSVQPTLVWEKPQYPSYYLPLSDVRAELIPTRVRSRRCEQGVHAARQHHGG